MLHYTAMQSADAACRALCDPEREVSAHYLIDEAGVITNLVAEEMRAWHAGAGSWQGRDDVNSRSIGIELANPGTCPFAAAQMTALEQLLHDISKRWAIPPEGVIGHSDMAPGRKIDPGSRFDWRRLALGGLAIWPADGTAPVDAELFRDRAKAIGWPPVDDDLLLTTMRLRFRPWATGPLAPRDMGIVLDIAARYGN